MRSLAGVLALVLFGACGHPPPIPPVETAVLPPPGEPPPRLGHLPGPPPNPGAQPADLPEQQRFLTLQGGAYNQERAREARERRESLEQVEHVDLVEEPTTPVEACSEVPPQGRMGCPIGPPEAVERVQDIPGGARVVLKPGTTSASVLRKSLDCQKALAAASGPVQPLCPFLDEHSVVRVKSRHNRVLVDITGAADARTLRTQLRSAFDQQQD